MLFANLVVNWPGSAHDSRVFRESGICAALNRGDYNGILLGDKGYRCDNNLYNAAHSKTRNLIERTFGVLKKKVWNLTEEVTNRAGHIKKNCNCLCHTP